MRLAARFRYLQFNVNMYRAPRRIILALLLGAITTVAVAWGCGWRSLPDTTSMRWGTSTRSAGRQVEPPVHAWSVRGFGIERVHIMFSNWTEFGEHYQPLELTWPWWLGRDDFNARDDGSGVLQAAPLAQGWPLAALWCEFPDYNTIQGGILLSREAVPNSYLVIEHVLAFRPIWRGFALDTTIYGIAWFAMLFVPGLVRRANRRRQNRCTACGYDLRGSKDARCPECGAATFNV
ncbi:MAG TPA: hypothetical protein VMS30_06465 [Phycisphaerales bacterium]|nr:hypothetical protein [Phycisphaerales bacterium]